MDLRLREGVVDGGLPFGAATAAAASALRFLLMVD
jgi:hypothetical protein